MIVKIGRAPGFEPMTEDLQRIVDNGLASRFEVRGTDVTLYTMGMQSNQPRDMQVRFTPTLAANATAPASTIYAYYEPALHVDATAVRFDVRGE